MAEQSDMTLQQAARELRASLKRSQQSMATLLGLSMAALRNYESGTVTAPDARAANAYMMVAETCDRPDLVAVFRRALRHAIGIGEPEMKTLIENLCSNPESYDTLCRVCDDAMQLWEGMSDPYPQYLKDLIVWLKSAGSYDPRPGCYSGMQE